MALSSQKLVGLGLGLGLGLLGCDPLVVDEALVEPALEVSVAPARLVGPGVTAQVTLTGCARATLRPSVSGRALAARGLTCDVGEACRAELTVSAAELVAAVGIEAFTDTDRRAPFVEVDGTCEELGRPLPATRADVEARLFSAAARVADPPERLFVRDVDGDTRALWAESASGVRVLGYDDAAEVRGALDDRWWVWRGRSARIDSLTALGELVLSVESCRFGQRALCPQGLEPRLVASDWGRKLVDLDALSWPGATIEGLLATDQAAWAYVDFGAGRRLAAIDLAPRPMQAALPSAGAVREDEIDWRGLGRGRAVGLGAAGELYVARVEGATLAIDRVTGLSRPVARIRDASLVGDRAVVITSREPEPRLVLLDARAWRVLDEIPVPDAVEGAFPTPRGIAVWTRAAHTVLTVDGPVTTPLPAGEEIRVVLARPSGVSIVVTWPSDPTGPAGRILRLGSGEPEVLLDRLHLGGAPEHDLGPFVVVGDALYGATGRVVFRIDLDPEPF